MDTTPQHIGPYTIVGHLGRGGMGVVYRAMHEDGRIVALKTVRLAGESQLTSIRREIHALARLRHPGIVRILDEGVADGCPWYAMELLDGTTLKRLGRQVARESEDPQPTSVETLLEHPAAGESLTQLDLLAKTSEPGREENAEDQRAHPGRDAELARQPREEGRPETGQFRAAAADFRGAGDDHSLVSFDLLRLLRPIRRLCAALAYLHGEGLVHRDLKLGNVVVRPDGTPVLVDFGLATQFTGDTSREALTAAGFTAGTVSGMAPEQIRGELLDARADLYALGCMIYELSTGRPPFIGDIPVEVLWQHLHAEPEPPSKLVPGLPPALEELTLRLLAKDRRSRPGHAEDVASALERMGVTETLDDALAGRESWPKPKTRLYRPALAGREQTLSEFERHLDSLREGRGGLVLISGESGIGKTRVLLELARRAEARRIRVLSGECTRIDTTAESALGQGGPLHPLRKALRAVADTCRELGPEQAERLVGGRRKVLAPYEPALDTLPDSVPHPEPARLSNAAARARLFSSLLETFVALAAETSVLLVLDDLQWADELTLGFLEFVAKAAAERSSRLGRLSIVGAYRSEAVPEQLDELSRAPVFRSVRLGRLDDGAVSQMVCDMLGLTEPPEVFAGYLSRHSEGNPFFVAEYLRTAVREGVLWRDEVGVWQVADEDSEPDPRELYEHLPLPQSIWQLVAWRLDGLGATAAQLAAAASVLGKDVDGPLLARVTGLDPVSLLEGTLELMRSQVMEESGIGGLRFAHDKLREVAYQRIPTDRVVELHRRAAEGLESLPADRRDENLSAIGYHWERAGDAERARSAYLGAAERSRLRYAQSDTERLYRAYLRLVARPTPESLRVRYLLAFYVLRFQARHEEAIQVLTLAEQEALATNDRASEARALWSRGCLHKELGQAELGEALLERALAIAVELGDREQEAIIVGNLGVDYGNQGRFAEGRALLARGLSIHRERCDERLMGATLLNLATVCANEGSSEEARRHLEEALPLLRKTGDREMEGLAIERLAMVKEDLGYPEAEVTAGLEHARAVHKEVGSRRTEARVTTKLLVTEATRSDLFRSRELFERALELSREVGHKRLEGLILLDMAIHLRRAGRPSEANQALERALVLLREAQVRNAVGLCHCEQAYLALVEGRSPRPYLEDARAVARELQLRETDAFSKAIDRCRQAIEAADAGEYHRLHNGELIEAIPTAVRRWLVESGQLPISQWSAVSDQQ